MSNDTLNVPYYSKNETDETQYILFDVKKDCGSIEDFGKNSGAKFNGLSAKTRVVELGVESFAWVKKNSVSKVVREPVAKKGSHLVLVQCSHEVKVGTREFAL